MSLVSFLLVLVSAFMHAGWNFFTKKAVANKIAMLAVGWLIAGLLFLPIALFHTDLSLMSVKWIPFFAYTAVIHALYLYLLGWSYSIGEMSLIYPVARGVGILMTVIIVVLFEMDTISSTGFIGIGLLVLGIVFMSLKKFKDIERRAAIFVSVLVGICVSFYSIVDKISVLHIPPLFYITIMFCTSPLLLMPIMLNTLRAQTYLVWTKHKFYSGAIGVVSLITYLMILFALRDSPTPYVIALREISIVIGGLLGIMILNEERNKRKIIGLVMIILGAIVIKIA